MLRVSRPGSYFCAALVSMGLLSACSEKPKDNPFENKAAPVAPPALSAPPKLEGPPDFVVDDVGPKVGWTRALVDKPDGKQKLAEEIEKNKKYVSGEAVKVRVDRKSKVSHVAALLEALGNGGASSMVLSTETRPEFPASVSFAPSASGKAAPTCSVVAKVLTRRQNAVWSLKGGVAVESGKGMAGPDMEKTKMSLEAAAGRCKESDFVFIAGDEDVEWGLIYDLAASTQTLEKIKLGKVILLDPAPTAGRPVK